MKIEKNKVVFAAILAVIVIFLICYGILLTEPDPEEQQLLHTEIPALEQEQIEYDSKLDALNDLKEVKAQTAPSIYDENLLDSLGYYDPEYAEKEKERVVDSIYRANQKVYGDQESKTYARTSNQKHIPAEPSPEVQQQERQVVRQELGLEHQLFFAAATSTSLKVTPMSTGKTNVVQAVVDGDQVVKANSRIRLRLTTSVSLPGSKIPKNTVVFGTISFQPNRALITIEQLKHHPVTIIAYDLQDGLEGIYVENNFRAQASSEVMDDVLQDINIPSLPQVSGISQLLRRDNRNVKVTVLNNYRMLLKIK